MYLRGLMKHKVELWKGALSPARTVLLHITSPQCMHELVGLWLLRSLQRASQEFAHLCCHGSGEMCHPQTSMSHQSSPVSRGGRA